MSLFMKPPLAIKRKKGHLNICTPQTYKQWKLQIRPTYNGSVLHISVSDYPIKFYKNGNYFAESIASKRNQTIISIIKENFEKVELEAVVSEHNMYRMKDLENLSSLINAKAIEEGLKEDCLIYSFNDLDKNEIIEIFELQYGT